jgi:hypothetical protein
MNKCKEESVGKSPEHGTGSGVPATPEQIKAAIKTVEGQYEGVLTGKISTIRTNPERAMMQLEAGAKLRALHWCLGTKYESKLRGVE